MTGEELCRIKEHIEIHAKREPRAVRITQILRKAVKELETTKELQEKIDVLNLQVSELIEQRQYWKDSSFDWRHKFFKKGLVKRLVKKDRKLNRAKRIIKEYMRFEPMIGTCSFYSEEYERTKKKAKDFLKE